MTLNDEHRQYLTADQRARYPDATQDDSIQVGLEYQDYRCDRLVYASPPLFIQNYCSARWQEKAESRQNIEIKCDLGCRKYGHLAIEWKKRNRFSGHWFKSGIQKPSLFYLQGDYSLAFLFKTETLREYFRRSRPKLINDNPSTVEKFYLGLYQARGMAERVFEYHDDGSVTG